MTMAKTFRDAACVVLVRGHGRELEAFWVRRGALELVAHAGDREVGVGGVHLAAGERHEPGLRRHRVAAPHPERLQLASVPAHEHHTRRIAERLRRGHFVFASAVLTNSAYFFSSMVRLLGSRDRREGDFEPAILPASRGPWPPSQARRGPGR